MQINRVNRLPGRWTLIVLFDDNVQDNNRFIYNQITLSIYETSQTSCKQIEMFDLACFFFFPLSLL